MSSGLSGEIIASATEHGISSLKAAPKRITCPDVPIPYVRVTEKFRLPDPDRIVVAWHDMKVALPAK